MESFSHRLKVSSILLFLLVAAVIRLTDAIPLSPGSLQTHRNHAEKEDGYASNAATVENPGQDDLWYLFGDLQHENEAEDLSAHHGKDLLVESNSIDDDRVKFDKRDLELLADLNRIPASMGRSHSISDRKKVTKKSIGSPASSPSASKTNHKFPTHQQEQPTEDRRTG